MTSESRGVDSDEKYGKVEEFYKTRKGGTNEV